MNVNRDISSIVYLTIICEGDEEEKYIKRLISLHLPSWNKNIIIRTRNAHGIDNIINRLKYEIKAGQRGLFFIYCDAGMDEGYKSRQSFKEILSFTRKNFPNVKDSLVYFASPVTLLVVLSHFGKVHLNSEDKAHNKREVYLLSGVNGYGESGDKIDMLMSKN